MKRTLLTGILAASILGTNFACAYNQEFKNDVNYQKGVISLNSNKYYEAIKELNLAIGKYPNIIEVKNNLVDAYYRSGIYNFNKTKDYRKAANDFRAAIYYLKYYKITTAVDLEKVYIIESNLNNCLIKQKLGLDFKARFNEAKKLRGQGLFKQAVVELNEASKDQVIRAKCLDSLGDLMVVLDDTEKAARYYENVVLIEPKNYDAHLKFARVLEELGFTDKAIQEYNIATQGDISEEEILPALEQLAILSMEKYPDNASSYLNLGAVYQKKKDYVTSLNYYKKAQKLDPSNPLIKLNMGSLYQAQNQYEDAIKMYNEVLAVHPYDKLAHLYRAQAYQKTKQYQKAIDGFKTVVKIDPEDKLAKEELLDTIRNYLPQDEVIAYFEKASNSNSKDETVQFLYANELFKNKMYDKAAIHYKKTIEINYKNINAYINASNAYQSLSRYDEAENILKAGLDKNPNDADLELHLATVSQNKVVYQYKEASKFYSKGDYKSALKFYQAIEKQNKDTYVNIAACYQAMKKYDDAIIYYNKALKEDSKDSNILYYLGTVNYSQNNYENANVLYKKALALDPENKEIKQALNVVNIAHNQKLMQDGLDSYNGGKYDVAIKNLNQLVKRDVKNAYGFYYRGLSYDALKNKPKAIADYQKAVELLPTFDVAYYALAVCYDTEKNLAKAKETYAKFVKVSKGENVYTAYAKDRLKEIEEELK